MSEHTNAKGHGSAKEPTYHEMMDLSKARREILTHGHTHIHEDAAPKRAWNSVPMFVPTDTHGHSILHIKRRQDVLNDWIGLYKEWQVTKAASMFLVLMSIILIPRNVFVAGAFALAGGFAYGRYHWQDYFFSTNWKKRMLLEAT
jgi:hypothetical protein